MTTLFADLVGFTALGERQDPEDIDAALRGFYALARTIVERFGGTVEKFIGDAVVGLFGVPVAHEDDAERAARSALELVARVHELPAVGGQRLEVRCAVNTGPALVRLDARPEAGEGVLVGDAVNTCARLLVDAPAMSTVAGERTYALSQRAIAYEPLPPVRAKGKSGLLRRWVARGAIARRGTDADRHREAPMIGREVELALLSGLLDRAVASNEPQFVLVSGEAGIGKSRLLREFFRLVDERPAILCNWRQGHCPPYGSGLAYWALREIASAHLGISPSDTTDVIEQKLLLAADDGVDEWVLARLRPLAGLPAPAEMNERHAAWTLFLESVANRRPAIVAIEDLQWASQQTLEFLQHFVRNASAVPLLLVGTARPEFLDRRPRVFETSPRVAHLELQALSRSESERLTEALAPAGSGQQIARQAAERCGGNPLFAEELVRFWAERGHSDVTADVLDDQGAPTSILALIAARLDALPPVPRDLLSLASVVGQSFWPGAVAALGGHEPDDVRAGLRLLEERGFVRRRADSSLQGEHELVFWHALVRDVAYARLPRSSRAARHFALARWLDDRLGEGDHLFDVVAHHYATGLSLSRAANNLPLLEKHRIAAREALVRAGDRALRLDVEAAELHYARAAETVLAAEHAPFELLIKRGEALRAVGRIEEAAGLQEEAVRLAEADGDALRRAYALSRLAFTLSWYETGDSHRVAQQAVGLLGGEATTESIAVLEMWATQRLWHGDLPGVLETTRRILEMTERLGFSQPARSLGLHGYARFNLGDVRGLSELEDAIAIAERAGSAQELFGIREAYARCVCVSEDPERALASIRQWIAEAERRRDRRSFQTLSQAEARYLLLSGRWEDALANATELAQGDPHGQQLITQAERRATLLAAHLGMEARREASLEAARYEELLPRLSQPIRFGTICAAAAASGCGDDRHASALLAGLLSALDFAADPTDLLWWPLAVRTALAIRRSDLAAALAREASVWPSCPPRVRLTLDALLAEDEGDAAVAAAAYTMAAKAWRAGKSPLEDGLALLGLGRCLRRLDRTEEAASALSHARSVLAGVDARSALAELDGLLQTADASADRGTDARPK